MTHAPAGQNGGRGVCLLKKRLWMAFLWGEMGVMGIGPVWVCTHELSNFAYASKSADCGARIHLCKTADAVGD